MKDGSLTWNPHLKTAANNLAEKLNGIDEATFTKALQTESLRRHREFSEGIKRYWAYERDSDTAPPNIIWQAGTTRLLDFGNPVTSEKARPLLIIPSLINRYHVLDLSGGRSFVRYLAAQGFHPYIVDWDAPGRHERSFDLSSYITSRLESILDDITSRHQTPVNVIGYCMGGLLALGLVTRKPDQSNALALLATPWDFHCGHENLIMSLKAMQPQTNAVIDTLGEIPLDLIQAMFTSLSPWMTINKFRRFSHIQLDHKKQDDLFVELEDWLNNGTPLAGPTARECINGWYIENTPSRGLWCINAAPVLPAQVKCPTMVVVPKHDHIVPPQSAMAIIDQLPRADTFTVNHGHIGMIAGSNSENFLFKPLSDWLLKQT